MSDTSLVFNLVARDKATGELSAMGERFNTAAATIGAGFAAALGVSVMTHMNMEAAGSKLAAQLGVGPTEAARLAEVSAGVFKEGWGDSIETVNAAIKGVYQNIGDVSAVEGGLEGISKKALALAHTFDQEVGPVTAAIGQMLKTGLAKNATEAFDIVTRGFQTGANRADDLLDTITEYGTQWRKFGLDGATAMGLISQGLKAGARDADIVADSIKEFSIRSVDGSKTTADGFKAIGENATSMAAKIGAGGATATAALDLTLDKLRAMEDPVKREAAAVALFGTQAEDLGAALYSLDPSAAVAALGQVGGAADKMAKTVHDSPAAALEAFKRSVMVELGAVGGVVATFAMENTGLTKGLAYTLAGLAAVVLTVAAAQRVYAAYTAIATVATTVMNSASVAAVAGWARMMAWGLMTYTRIAAAAVASAATTAASWVGSALVSIGTWIAAVVRAGAVAVAQFAMMATRAVVWALTMAAQWLIAMGPIGWVIAIVVALVALVIANWDKILAFTSKIWPAIWGAIKWAGQQIWNFFLNWTIVGLVIKHWDKIKAGVTSKAMGLVSWMRGFPGMIVRALGSLGNLLVGKGQDVVRGLWKGIQGMGPWLRSTLSGWARRLVPGPIAKALGIASPSRVMAAEVGRWIPAGVVQGIEAGQPELARTMSTLVQAPPATAALATGQRLAPAAAPLARGGMAGAGVVTVRLETTGADSAVRTLLQKIVRVEGRGSVQVAFGQ
ncbi:phage tail tape measure protein [Streptomyces sp. NPDC006339]|uniref:phage tail tape measure protein n=1 Tax=Streptomyces sp. NPDC006339 TaxID=3156755 RepID=UPI0033B12947